MKENIITKSLRLFTVISIMAGVTRANASTLTAIPIPAWLSGTNVNEGRAVTPDGKYVVGFSGTSSAAGFLYDIDKNVVMLPNADGMVPSILTGVAYRTDPVSGQTQLILDGLSTNIQANWMTTNGGTNWGAKRRDAAYTPARSTAANTLGAAVGSDKFYQVIQNSSQSQLYINQGSNKWDGVTAAWFTNNLYLNVGSLNNLNGVTPAGRAVGYRRSPSIRNNYVIDYPPSLATAFYFNGLAGDSEGEAFCVSADGYIMYGRSPVSLAGTDLYGYKVVNPGGSQIITSLPEFNDTGGSSSRCAPYGCTTDGQIAVGMNFRNDEKAVLWDTRDPNPANWTVTDLTDRAISEGILGTFTGKLQRAYSVGKNATGNAVVTGVGVDSGGFKRGFVMVVNLPNIPVPATLAVGQTSTNHFTANGQYQYFTIYVPAGGNLSLVLNDLDGLGVNELYLRRGALPTPGVYDYRFSTNGAANQTVIAPFADSGLWYVLAYNASGPIPGDYTLTAQIFTDFRLRSVSPSSVGNAAPETIIINGSGLTPGCTAALTHNGNTYPASSVTFLSSQQLQVNFDFTAIPVDSYSLTVSNGTNSASLPFTVSLYDGTTVGLTAKIAVPNFIGFHNPATIYVEYSNTGHVAVAAPLFVVSASQNGRRGAIMTLNAAIQGQGFWTTALPQGFANTIQFHGGGNNPSLIQPGETVAVPIYYAGWQKPWDVLPIQFTLGILTATNMAPVDWTALKPTMQPAGISNEVWNVLWSNFTNQIGGTWGDYLRAVNADSLYLYLVQQSVNDISDLLAFEFAKADGLSIIQNLASAADAAMPTPGLGLSFSRVFPQPISRRYALSALGRGWSHNWDFSLSTDTNGTVTITGPAGSRRVFQPDTRTGGAQFFNQSGDHGVLANLGGGRYSLTESHGLATYFRNDGKLDFIQDLNSNRVTAAWSGNLLTSLTHSSGQKLQFTYAGNLIQTVSDSVGRTTTFSYDGAQHLTNVLYFDGSQVSYSYSIGNGAAREHALTQVAYPSGTHQFFSYDANGRLATMSRDAGTEAVTFGYSGGIISVTDAFTNTMQFHLDHHGLLAKVVNPQTNTVQLAYDGNFNLTRITDPVGRATAYSYDSLGNLVATLDSLGGQTRFNYTGTFNRLGQLTDAKGNVTRYSYNPKGNLAAITYADTSVEGWAYDALGNPTTWTNRRANGITYQFNTNSQMTAKLYPDGSQAIYKYDARGNLTLASNYVGAINLTYYTNDRLHRITYPGNRWLEYTYCTCGRRESMTDQLGYRIDYLYDSAGRLQSLTNSTNGELVRYAYDAAGRLALKTLGNGVYSTYGYDAAGQLLTLTNAKPDNSVLSFFNYTYDSRGRRVQMNTHYGAWTYGYDDLGQLTSAVLASTSTNVPSQNLNYTYDALGNRVQTVENGVTTAYSANSLNQYVQVGNQVLSYDADGSLTQKVAGATTLLAITNNFDNRVTGYDSTNGQRVFNYDALGFPSVVVRNGSTNFQVYDPAGMGDLVGLYDNTGTFLERQYHGQELIGTLDGALQTFLTADGIGNVSDFTGSGGASDGSQVFSPFGTQLTGGAQRLLGFNGALGVIQEGDLVFMRARFYDAGQGRFFSEDPLGIGGRDINLYRYARNTPVRLSDPSGKCPLCLRILLDPRTWRIAITAIDAAAAALADGYMPITKWGDWVGNARGAWDAIQDEWNKWQGRRNKNDSPEAPDDVSDPLPKRDDLPTGYDGMPGNGGNFPGGNDPNLPGYIPPVPPTDPSGPNQKVPVSTPSDPNSLTGPGGYGPQNYVAGNSLFTYRIDFENASNATAPAQVVVVSNPLTNTLDWSTFQLTEIGFGDYFFAVAAGSQHYANTLHLTSTNGFQFDLQMDVGLNPATGLLYANFTSVNPTNGLPPPVDVGFLPPEPVHNTNDTPAVPGQGRGQGHISYTIRPKTNLVTGTQIRNVASITFDQNPAIATDLVDSHNVNSGHDTNRQALVTIDGSAPSSSVNNLPATATNVTFMVCWSGNDVGSGIANYDVYVSTNNGPWNLWLGGITNTCASFQGDPSVGYGFYSVAHDQAGNVGPSPGIAQATTTVPANSAPIIYAAGMLTNRVLAMDFTSTLGSLNVVQTSTNLTNWSGIGLLTNTLGSLEFQDFFASNYPKRFYRVFATSNAVGPMIISQPQSQAKASGSNAQFLVVAAGTSPLSYQWQKDGTNLAESSRITGSQSSVMSISNLITADAGNYVALITNVAGAATSSPAILTVSAWPKSAREWQLLGYTNDGVYPIDPDGTGQPTMSVNCLMSLSGGGWTQLAGAVAYSSLNTNASALREYLYVKNGTSLWYLTPMSSLVWSWSSGKDLYGTYYYSSGGGEASFAVTSSGEHQAYGVGGSSGPGNTYKCLVINPTCLDVNTAQVQLCQDLPAIFGPVCPCGVTVYMREFHLGPPHPL